MSKIILEQGYKRKDGSMYFNLHELNPRVKVNQDGVLTVDIEDDLHFCDLLPEKEGNGYIYRSHDRNLIMCHAIKKMLEGGFSHIEVTAEDIYGKVSRFNATSEMTLEQIEENFKRITKR